MKKFIITCCACVGVGGGIGYLAGNSLSQVPGEEGARSDAPRLPRFGVRDGEGVLLKEARGKNISRRDELGIFLRLQGSRSSDQLRAEFEQLYTRYKAEEGGDVWEQMQFVFRKWGAVAPRQALEELEKLEKNSNGFLAHYLRSQVFTTWVKKDPQAVVIYFEQEENKKSLRYLEDYVAPAFQIWAEHDPEEAWKHLPVKPSMLKNNLWTSYVEGLVKNSQEKIQEYAVKLPQDVLDYLLAHSEAMSTIVDAWREKDAKGLQDWMQTLSEEQQNELKTQQVSNLFKTDFDAAIGKLGEFPREMQLSILYSSFRAICDNKGEKGTMDWLMENGFEDVAFNRGRVQSRESEKFLWLKGLEPGKWKDDLIQKNVLDRNDRSFSDTLFLAESISDKEVRLNCARHVVSCWCERDLEGAERWVKDSSWSEEEKNALLNKVQEERSKKGIAR